MTADPLLTLAWLVLAHLVADFVIQTNQVATDKFGSGRRAWTALGTHALGVAICLVPIAVAFGLPGLAVLLVVVASHTVVDRVKIVWTMRVEASALAEALARHEGPAPAASLGTAWTPMPAFLFVLDQLAHVIVLLATWAIFLASAPPADGFASFVRATLAAADPATAHRVVLISVVLLALAIVNVRAASLLVATLVHPREAVTGDEDLLLEEPADAVAGLGAARARGPMSSGMEAAHIPALAAAASRGPHDVVRGGRPRPSLASPARVGATIGVLERLLIVAFVLTNATAAVGFVVAAKTIARFKQLDDRQFAEYYLLGTLASVSVALASGLVAAAVLAPR
jgi:hypothetical protein